jgi:hypothetical protein
MAKALSAAGLLVTPDHEAALAACEERAKHPHILYSDCSEEQWERTKAASLECIAVGRRSLDAKKPKQRYYVELFASGSLDEYRVRDRARLAADVRGFGTKAECEAIVAALSALDAKEAGR